MEKLNIKASHRSFQIIVYAILLLVILVVTVGIWIGFGRYEFLQKEKESKLFIGQIINSVLADTDFYKSNSSSDTIKDMEDCRGLMSKKYVISTIDYSWEIFEAKILFHNTIGVKVDVAFRDNKPFLKHFRKLRNESL